MSIPSGGQWSRNNWNSENEQLASYLGMLASIAHLGGCGRAGELPRAERGQRPRIQPVSQTARRGSFRGQRISDAHYEDPWDLNPPFWCAPGEEGDVPFVVRILEKPGEMEAFQELYAYFGEAAPGAGGGVSASAPVPDILSRGAPAASSNALTRGGAEMLPGPHSQSTSQWANFGGRDDGGGRSAEAGITDLPRSDLGAGTRRVEGALVTETNTMHLPSAMAYLPQLVDDDIKVAGALI